MSGWLQAIAAIAGGLLSFASVIFFAGRFSQQLRDTREDVARHDVKLDKHSDQLSVHQAKIGELSAWRDGYNAATRASHETNGQA